MAIIENQIERDLIARLGDLKYTLRPDIRDFNLYYQGVQKRIKDQQYSDSTAAQTCPGA